MKLLHTGDLHLGKKLNKISLIENQKQVLKEIDQANADEILSTIKKQLPDHQIIIASIYDYDNFFDNKISISERLIDTSKN